MEDKIEGFHTTLQKIRIFLQAFFVILFYYERLRFGGESGPLPNEDDGGKPLIRRV